ncbi:MAG: hypothetical protein AB1716_15215 [Planctomycetota bacterium]
MVTSAPLNERGALAADTPCVQCEYNLRGLTLEGKCPECGTPILSSASPPALRCMPATWLDAVARGLSILAWAPAIALFCGLSILVSAGEPVCAIVGILAISGALALGVLRAGSAPAAAHRSEAGGLARFGAYVLVVFTLLTVWLVALDPSGEWTLITFVLWIVGAVIAVCGTLAHLANVLADAYAPKLARACRRGMLALYLGSVLFIGAIAGVLGRGGLPNVLALAGGGTALTVALVALVRTRRLIRHEARVAAGWRAAHAATSADGGRRTGIEGSRRC